MLRIQFEFRNKVQAIFPNVQYYYVNHQYFYFLSENEKKQHNISSKSIIHFI